MKIPEKCRECPIAIEAAKLADSAGQYEFYVDDARRIGPFVHQVTRRQAAELETVIDECPGEQHGVKAFFSFVGRTLKESFTYGAPVTNLDTGLTQGEYIYPQSVNCPVNPRDLDRAIGQEQR